MGHSIQFNSIIVTFIWDLLLFVNVHLVGRAVNFHSKAQQFLSLIFFFRTTELVFLTWVCRFSTHTFIQHQAIFSMGFVIRFTPVYIYIFKSSVYCWCWCQWAKRFLSNEKEKYNNRRYGRLSEISVKHAKNEPNQCTERHRHRPITL